MLKLLSIITLAVMLLLPEFSFCTTTDAQPLSEKLCELRQMICGGGAGLGIALVVIVTIGLMTIIGKINWSFVVIMSACLIFYFSANMVASWVIDDDVDCECNDI